MHPCLVAIFLYSNLTACLIYLLSIHLDHNQQCETQLETGHTGNSQPTMPGINNESVSEAISVPTQVVDDGVTEVAQVLQNIMEQKQCIVAQKDKMNHAIYQNCLRQLEKEEVQCKRELQLHQTESQSTISNTIQCGSQLEDLIEQMKAIELQRQAVDNEINQRIKELEIKCVILTSQVEMLKTTREDTCKCHLLYQAMEDKEHFLQQLQKFKLLYNQEAEQVGKLKAYLLDPTYLTARYEMNKSPHGIAVIINNHNFYQTTPTTKLLPNSRGTKNDIENLQATWKHLGYHVLVFNNLSASEVIYKLRQIASSDHEKYDSFVCCILSHGYLDGVYGADGELVRTGDIASLFKCQRTLAGKPKLFFIYTICEFSSDKEAVPVSKIVVNPCDNLPAETDFLFVCSNNMSWRKRSKYISLFREVTKKCSAEQHLHSLLTIINYKMSEAYEHQSWESRQSPAYVISLHKKMFLKTSMEYSYSWAP